MSNDVRANRAEINRLTKAIAAEEQNINLVAVNSSAAIGGEQALNAVGFIGFTQAMTSESNNRSTPNANDLKDFYIENCTIQNLPIKAKNGA